MQIKDAAWHAKRRKGIGGSDAGAVLGISPFKSPLRLWMEKRGEIEPEDIETNESVYFGTILEDVVAKVYEQRTGRELRKVEETLIHPKYPWMLCNVDRLIVGYDAIAEIKCTGIYSFYASDWGEDGSSIVPPYYYAQAQHNLAVTGRAQCEMPVLIGGNQFRVFHLPRDDKFIATLIAEEQKFMDALASGEHPKPIDSADLLLLFPDQVPGKHIDLDETPLAIKAWAELCKIKPKISAAKKLVEGLEFVIKSAMGDAERASFGGTVLATWKTNKAGSRVFKLKMKGAENGADE